MVVEGEEGNLQQLGTFPLVRLREGGWELGMERVQDRASHLRSRAERPFLGKELLNAQLQRLLVVVEMFQGAGRARGRGRGDVRVEVERADGLLNPGFDGR